MTFLPVLIQVNSVSVVKQSI